jgi:hypothetical protein
MTQTKVEAPFVENNRPFRNLVINGDMQIAQRATSATTAVTNTYNTVDRWKPVFSMDGAFTMAQSALSAADIATTGHQYALDIQCSTADTSIGAAQYAWVAHLVEANNCRDSLYGSDNAKSLTISFWVKSNLTGTTCGMVAKEDTTYTQAPFEFTINSANTWEHKTVTIPANAAIKSSAGAIAYNVGVGLYLAFHLAMGGNYDNGTNLTWATGGTSYATTNQLNFLSSTDNDLFITGVQMEFGDAKTSFEYIPTDVQLQRCRRYCQQHTSTSADYYGYGVGHAVNANLNSSHFYLHPNMRAAATLETSSTASDFAIYSNSSGVDACDALPVINGTGDSESGGIRVMFQSTGDITADEVHENVSNNAATFIRFVAEL